MKKKIIIVSILLVLVLLTIILAVQEDTKNDEKFNIVTSFYPMYIATLNITDGIDDVRVANLTSEVSGCIHDYVLTTTELVKLTKADVLVVNGAGMESFMDKIITNFNSLNIIDASEDIELIYEHCEESEDENKSENMHEHHDHNHEVNSHVFVSVRNHIKQVENICSKLVKIDYKNKDKYEENTKIYIEKLKVLEKDIIENIKSIKNTNIITFHNSFEYFAQEYGLNIIEVIEKEHGEMPSAGELARIIQSAKMSGVNVIFVEPEYNVKTVSSIAKEIGAKIYVLNPVTNGEKNKDEYLNIMRKNLNVLKEALS